MHYAAQEGHEAVVQMLLKAGADVKAVDNNGKRPADGAWWPNMRELLEAEG